MRSTASAGSPKSARMQLAAAARSGAVSINVPSRSISTACNAFTTISRHRTAFAILGTLRLDDRLADLLAHRLDDRLVILRTEDGAARHKRVGAGCGDRADVVDLHATVDLEIDRISGELLPRIDARSRCSELGQ